jgi:hypothetical protein
MCRYMGGWTLEELRSLAPEEVDELVQMITAENSSDGR